MKKFKAFLRSLPLRWKRFWNVSLPVQTSRPDRAAGLNRLRDENP